jgi:hypothetical protein
VIQPLMKIAVPANKVVLIVKGLSEPKNCVRK